LFAILKTGKCKQDASRFTPELIYLATTVLRKF